MAAITPTDIRSSWLRPLLGSTPKTQLARHPCPAIGHVPATDAAKRQVQIGAVHTNDGDGAALVKRRVVSVATDLPHLFRPFDLAAGV